MKDYTADITTYFEKEKRTLDLIDKASLSQLLNLLESAREERRQIFIMGNGGSGATASHFCCDFNKGISLSKETRYRMICLNDNVPTLLAYANDIGYDEVFVGLLQNYFRPGDVVIGISGSGNSSNVVRAIQWAKEHEGITVALTGYDGGQLKQTAEFGVHVPVDDMQITEDLHMVLGHCMMRVLC